MTVFFFLLMLTLALLAGVILALVMRGAAMRDIDRAGINVAIFRERLAELDIERDGGKLDAGQHAALVAELKRMLVDDVSSPPVSAIDAITAPVPSSPTKNGVALKWPALLVLLLVPALALTLYLLTGYSADARAWLQLEWRAADVAALPQPLTADNVAEKGLTLVDAARLTQATLPRRPADAEDWFRLGMTWLDLNAPMLGVESLRTARRLAPGNTDITLTLARVELAMNRNQLNDSVRELLDSILVAEPGHQGVLMVYGMAAFESGDFATAAARWEQLLAQIDPATSGADLLRRSIAKARAGQQTAATGAVIPVQVVLPAGAENPPADAVLFVVVRAAGGPPMPVAAKKLPPNLPVELTLTDADQMMPGASLAARGKLEVLARISRTGSPMPASGDMQSAPTQVVFPLDKPVILTLDRRVP